MRMFQYPGYYTTCSLFKLRHTPSLGQWSCGQNRSPCGRMRGPRSSQMFHAWKLCWATVGYMGDAHSLSYSKHRPNHWKYVPSVQHWALIIVIDCSKLCHCYSFVLFRETILYVCMVMCRVERQVQSIIGSGLQHIIKELPIVAWLP